MMTTRPKPKDKCNIKGKWLLDDIPMPSTAVAGLNYLKMGEMQEPIKFTQL